MATRITFSEEQIQSLFGYEAAEDEKIARLQSYFFKTDAYNKVNADLPLRILVGHKGIGKSAIFRIAYQENQAAQKLALWVRPDDIADLCNVSDDTPDFLKLIRTWKEGLEKLIYDLVIDNIGNDVKADAVRPHLTKGLKILNSVVSLLQSDKFSIDASKKIIANNFLKSKSIYVYIDDLDRGWTGSLSSIRRISALLSAVRDLSNDNEGLNFRISLRSDVYYLVRTSDESTDKIDGSVIWLSWSTHEILALLAKRVQTYLGTKISERELMKQPQFIIAGYLNPVFTQTFAGEGKWKDVPIHKVLTSMIRRRPRDLVKLCVLAAREANNNNHTIIDTEDLRSIFDKYSQDRVRDVINEHRYELPEIERLIMGMKPSKVEKKAQDMYVYCNEKIIQKIAGIMQEKPFIFADGTKASPEDLLFFLYKINFLVGRKQTRDGYIDRRYFEDQQYISTPHTSFGYLWEVHPAYRWALYPERKDIFSTIDLEESV